LRRYEGGPREDGTAHREHLDVDVQQVTAVIGVVVPPT
jgi:hypothetical protein